MGLALYYAELWSPARYYKEAIRLNSISEIRERIAIWTAWYTFIKECNFTSFQSVYGCLSVYRHNVSPHFHHCCLLQLSLPTFKLPFCVHFTWHNSIWRHWSLLWQHKNTVFSQKVAFCVRDSLWVFATTVGRVYLLPQWVVCICYHSGSWVFATTVCRV